MIFKIEKRKRRVNGVLKATRSYYLRYRIGNMPADKWVSLKTADKSVANSEANKFLENLERERAGLLPPKNLVQAANAPLSQLAGEYIEELRSRGRDAKYVDGTEKRITNVSRDCRWQKLRDVSAESFMAWRRSQTLKVKTLNDYLIDVSSFFGWLVKMDRIDSNPLGKVERIARNEEEEEKRRAFTPEEFQRLLSVSAERSLLYSVAVCSGLRKKELKLLAWGDVVTSGDGDTLLRLRSNTTKNRKAETVPVPRWCAEELLKSRPVAAVETSKVFPVLPRMPRFYKDLEAAGIPAVDERGHKAVFHSFRHTLATWLFQSGANPRAIQGIMRHSTIELSANQYTNFRDSEYRDASNLLPAFEVGGYTQIRAQISGKTGHIVSQAGETGNKSVTSQSLMDKGLSRLESGVVAVGRMVRAAGFEPATPSV